MPTYYVDADASGSGDGSIGDPFANVQFELLPVLASGDTVYFRGDFRGQESVFEFLDNLTLMRWPGAATCRFRGDVVLSTGGSGGWTGPGAGNSYSRSVGVGGGATICAIVQDWDTRTDSAGRHYGHLKPDTLVNVQAGTAGTFNFTSGTLTICLGAGGAGTSSDPNASASGTIAYVESGRDGWFFNSCNTCTVDGIDFALYCDPTPGKGYGIQLGNCTNFAIRNVTSIDNGYHHIGAPGGVCTGHVMTSCVAWGGNSPTGGSGTSYVMYAGTGNVSGCRYVGCTVYPYTLLGRTIAGDGLAQVIDPTLKYKGFYSHASPGTVTDLEYQLCFAVFHGTAVATCNGTDPFATDSTTRPGSAADRDDWTKYPVRVYRCTVTGGAGNITVTSMAWHRCRMSFDRVGAVWTGSIGPIRDAVPASVVSQLFDACEVVTKLPASGAASYLFHVNQASTDLIFINCSVVNFGTTSNQYNHFFSLSSTVTGPGIRARGCIWSHRTNNTAWHRLTNGNSGDATKYDFEGCLYDNFATNGAAVFCLTLNTSIDQASEWLSSVDQTGTFTTTNPIADATYATLDLTTAAKAIASSASPHTLVGFNGLNYDSHLGAWQYGSPAGGGGTRSVRRTGLGIELSLVGAGSVGSGGISPT